MINDRPLTPGSTPLKRTTSVPSITPPDTSTLPPDPLAEPPRTRSRSNTFSEGETSTLSESQLKELEESTDTKNTKTLLNRSVKVPMPGMLRESNDRVPIDVPVPVVDVGPPPPPPRSWGQTLTDLGNSIRGRFRLGFNRLDQGVKVTSTNDNLKTFVEGLDPFGQLKAPPSRNDVSNPKYKNLNPDQCQAFLRSISITGKTDTGDIGARPAPDEASIDLALTRPSSTKSGVPRLQHAIWVGGPLKEGEPKHKAFMDQLVLNKQANPRWSVCVWTDQSREAMLNAPDDSDLGRMRIWASTNGIKLIPIDEVFAGENGMGLQELYRTEQLKGGTGRAAASDILRLEIINRFGGIYCDGDKPINKPMDEIAEYTHTHGDFITAQERGNFQNCGMCGKPGNPVTISVLEHIRDNYGQPREDFLDLQVEQQFLRPTRMEVILRTGPTIVGDVCLALEGRALNDARNSQHLMPIDFITPPPVYTTSWDPSKIHCHGERNLVDMVDNDIQPELLGDVQNRVNNALVQLHGQMQTPHVEPNLTPEQEQALTQAVEKGVTALVYGIWNNNGLLNLDLVEQHIRNCPNPALAREMILEVFRSPELQDVAGQVRTLQLPGVAPTKDNKGSPIPLPESTLDAIFQSHPPLFPNMRLQDFTLQHAAYMGNVQFLDYAVRNNLLDLNAVSSRTLEAGELNGNRDPVTESTFVTRQMSIFEAAVNSGQKDVIAYLSSQPGFGDWLMNKIDNTVPPDLNPLEQVAKLGQVDTIIWCLSSLQPGDRNRVDTSGIIGHLLEWKTSEEEDLTGDQQLGVLRTFAQGYQHETGQALNLANAGFSQLLLETIRIGEHQLGNELERLGASLDHLSHESRQELVGRLSGGLVDIPVQTPNWLTIALKTNLTGEMIRGQSSRYTQTLQTAKNAHATPPNMNHPHEVLAYLAKGLAYAQDHLDRDHKGRGSRVDGWRAGVEQIFNELGGIPARQRTPQQEALLQMARLTTSKLQEMRRR